MTDKEFLEYIKQNKIRTYKCLPQEIKDFLLNRFIDSAYDDEIWKMKEAKYRIENNIEEVPKCKVCGKSLKFYYGGFGNTCRSKECKKQYKIQRYIELYGGPSPFSLKDNQEKAKKTRLEKYGHEYYSNWEKTKKTNLEKYGVTNWLQSQDSKNRLKEKYGVEYGLQSRAIWEKTRKATIDKYGAAYNIEKFNKTMLERYGKKWFVQTKEFQERIDYDLKKQHEYLTRKKNHTFNSSKPEKESYDLLVNIFPEAKRHFKDKERYPFVCDLYIPEIDTFVELNYHWTHGPCIFDPDNSDCIELLNRWKENKDSKYYQTAIDVWTIRDIKKRNTAKENNLNWIEFFNFSDFKEWIENLNKV